MSKKTLKRALCAVLAVAMSASLLTACGKKDAGGVGELQEDGSIKLTVTHWENDQTTAAMKVSYDQYMADHPGVTVELVAAPLDDYGTQISQMIASNTAPDVFQLGHDMGVSYFQRGLTYDWTEYAKAEPDLVNEYAPATYDQWHFADGTQFGLPGLLNVYGFFINKDAITAAGLDIPTNDWTWADFFDYAEKLKGDGEGQYGAVATGVWDAWWVNMISVANGGANMSEEILVPTELTIDDNYIATVQEITKHIQSGAISPASYETTGAQDVFKQGSIPIFGYGQWLLADLLNHEADLNFEWDLVATPKGTAKAATLYDCTGWGSPNYIKAPDQVWDLLKFNSSDMYKGFLGDQPVAAPAHIASGDVFYDKVSETHPATAEAVKAMCNMDPKTLIRFYPSWADDVNKIKDEKWNDIVDGNIDASELIPMFEQMNQMIKDETAE